jgi:hypothetical protein
MPAIRRMPPVVAAFSLFTIATFAVGISSSSMWDHPARATLLVLLLVLWLAAVVVWRQRWAWLLLVVVTVVAVVSPAWGEWEGAALYVCNVISLALLLSPGMRRWVGADKRRHRPAPT